MRRDKVLNILMKHKQELRDRYGVTRLGIFGSVARDEAAESSDVDIVVDMEPNLFARVRLKEDLESFLGTRVDLVRYWWRMNHYLKKRIDKEAYYV